MSNPHELRVERRIQLEGEVRRVDVAVRVGEPAERSLAVGPVGGCLVIVLPSWPGLGASFRAGTWVLDELRALAAALRPGTKLIVYGPVEADGRWPRDEEAWTAVVR